MRTRAWIILFVLVFSSCEQDGLKPAVDWDLFKTAVIHKDGTLIEREISKLLVNTRPKPTDGDLIGQKANIDKLVGRFNQSDAFTAELFCYACVYTNPPQSEIIITTDSAGTLIDRVIDVSTPKDDILTFAGVHDSHYRN